MFSHRQFSAFPTLSEFSSRPPIGVRRRHDVALWTVCRALLVKPRPLLVLPACNQLEVYRVDAARQPAGVVRLVPGRDPPAVVDLPHDLVAAADLFSYPHERVAVLVEGALITPAARRRLDAITDESLPEFHRFSSFLAHSAHCHSRFTPVPHTPPLTFHAFTPQS